MRIVLIIMLSIIVNISFGQKIELRNDSLYINKSYVNGSTSKLTLDSLLKTKGIEQKKKGKFKPGTREIMKLTSYTYKKEGLIFSKNDYDTSKITLAIKLYQNSNSVVDQNNMPTKTFKGELFIDNNYMNDKRKIEQLQKLINCSVDYKEISFESRSRIVLCKIVYQKRQIDVLFDFETNEATCIFIR